MPAERFYIPQKFNQDDLVEIDGLEFHHFVNVMRGKVGDRIELVNGTGSLAQAKVSKIEKKKAFFEIADITEEKVPQQQIILAQALPRLNRLDFIVEKGTELGMTELWLFPGERSERKELSESQLERMLSVCVAALKQCGRLYLPKIVIKPPLTDWQDSPFPLFFGDVSPDAPLLLDARKSEQNPSVVFCVGPESGFSPKEEDKLKDLGAKGVKLHHHILRTDTAAIAALTLLTHSI